MKPSGSANSFPPCVTVFQWNDEKNGCPDRTAVSILLFPEPELVMPDHSRCSGIMYGFRLGLADEMKMPQDGFTGGVCRDDICIKDWMGVFLFHKIQYPSHCGSGIALMPEIRFQLIEQSKLFGFTVNGRTANDTNKCMLLQDDKSIRLLQAEQPVPGLFPCTGLGYTGITDDSRIGP